MKAPPLEGGGFPSGLAAGRRMVKLNLRMDESLHAQLTAQAATDRRSLNAQILHFIEVGLTTAGNAGSPSGDPATSAPLHGKPDSSPT